MKERYEIEYKGKVKPKKTSFLSPSPIDMTFSGTIELDENDASKLPAIRKAFQKIMGKALSNQLAGLNQWLKEKDKYIAGMLKQHEVMKKSRIPSTSSEIDKYKKQARILNDFAQNMGTLDSEFREMVKNWATGARDQQAEICMMLAKKDARVKAYKEKSWRVKAGLVVKVVLVVAAIAVGVAAIVLSLGTATPAIVALASAGLAVSGIASIVEVGVEISKNANTEKKILANVQSDMKQIADALKPMESGKSSLKKHVTELENVIRVRQDSSKKLEHELKKKGVELQSYRKCLAALPESKDKELKKKEVKKIEKHVAKTQAKLNQLSSDIVASKSVLNELKDLGISLEKVSGQSANTVLGNLKERFSKIDGWVGLGKEVGGMGSSISGTI